MVRLLTLVAMAAWWMLSGCGRQGDIFQAAKAGDARAVERLLAAGTDPNAKEPKAGYTPLHIAAFSGRTEVVRVLLDHGAQVDARDNMDMTPLMEAVAAMKEENADAARLLIEHGANVGATTRLQPGTTALNMGDFGGPRMKAVLQESAKSK